MRYASMASTSAQYHHSHSEFTFSLHRPQRLMVLAWLLPLPDAILLA
jgi:hypothetical protein